MPFLPLLVQAITIPPDRPKVGETRGYHMRADVVLAAAGLKYELKYRLAWTTEVVSVATDGTRKLNVAYRTVFEGESKPDDTYRRVADALPDGSLTGDLPKGWAKFERMTSFVRPTGPVAVGGEWVTEYPAIPNQGSPACRIVFRLATVEKRDGKDVAIIVSGAKETGSEKPMEAETTHAVDLQSGERFGWTVDFRRFYDDNTWEQSGQTTTLREDRK